jgi:integrase
MDEKGSRLVAAKKQPKREKTRFPGVYSRSLINRNTGKPDTAFDITYRDKDGKKQWVLIGYKSDGVNAAYASQKRGALLDGITKGEKPKRKNAVAMTFGQGWELFKEKWLPNLANPKDEENRYKWYLEERLAHRRLDAITLLDLEDMKQALVKQGLSAATIRLALGDVRRIFRKLAAWGVYDGNIPTEGLVMPKLDNARTRFLTHEEAIKLLQAVKMRSQVWHDIAFLSLHTGMRKSEVLKLRREHLDFGTGSILVKNAKTGSRAVPMTDEVRPLLEELAPALPDALLFIRRGGGPHDEISSDSDESFVRSVEACKLNSGITDRRHKVVFHSLRHTYCSWLAMSGVPLFTIGELVGHSSTQMTKRYSHLCPDTKQEAASKIGEFMRNAASKQVAMAGHASSASEIQDTSE